MTDFAGRHVVVTGGTGALGAGVIDVLLARGATIHVPMLEAAAPPRLPAAVRATPGVAASDEGAIEAYYAGLPPLWASIHLAGGFAMKPIAETTRADLDAMWTMNAVTAFLASREAVRALRRGGGGGRIVNVAARTVLAPAGGSIAYVASKAAVAAITQSLAAEVRAEGILVNAVVPSVIDTPANRAAMPDADHARWPTPHELGEAIAFLASPANTVTSGALVPVYGRA